MSQFLILNSATVECETGWAVTTSPPFCGVGLLEPVLLQIERQHLLSYSALIYSTARATAPVHGETEARSKEATLASKTSSNEVGDGLWLTSSLLCSSLSPAASFPEQLKANLSDKL